MMIRRGMTPGILALLWAGLLSLSGLLGSIRAQEPLTKYGFSQRHMGVDVKLTLYALDEATAIQAAEAAYQRVAELDRIFSDYNPESEAMGLCRTSKPGRPVKVSAEMMTVLQESIRVSKMTNGAFDVTVGPLVKVWRRARRRNEIPPLELLAKAKSSVGYQFLKLDPEQGTVELLKDGMLLDFGGIAKGYAADEALKVLEDRGILMASIDVSGGLVVGDPPAGERAWEIGIAALKEPMKEPLRFLSLKNQGVATSGDAYQFVEFDGVRYSHLLNPHTGLGLTLRSSVTVVAPSGMLSDALASAVSVLGPEKGMELIESIPQVEALILSIKEDQVLQKKSSGWKDWEKSTLD